MVMIELIELLAQIPVTDPAVALAQAMTASAAQASASQQAVVQIAGVIVTTVGTVVLAFIAYKQAVLGRTMESTHQRATETAQSVEKIHVAVNSERTAMTDEIKVLREEIVSLREREVNGLKVKGKSG